MTVLGSLFTGISGLNAHSEALTTIGTNIANVSTTGYKKSRVAFEEVLRGVQLVGLGRSLSQGGLEGTENVTDLAISGDGYFIVSNGTPSYTRAGLFSVNKDGDLINPDGFILQGYQIDSLTGLPSGTLSDINLNQFTAQPQATANFSIAANLDASAANGDTFSTAFSAVNSSGGSVSITMNFVKDTTADIKAAGTVSDADANTTITTGGTYTGGQNQLYTMTVQTGGGAGTALVDVADASGTSLGVFTVTAWDTQIDIGSGFGVTSAFTSTNGTLDVGDSWVVGAMAEEWDWTVTPSSGTSTSSGSIAFDPTGTLAAAYDTTGGADNVLLAYDRSGNSLVSSTSEPLVTVTFSGGNLNDLAMTWDIVDTAGSSDMTGFDQASATFFTSQDGRAPGSLQDLSVGEDGVITGIFSNGVVLPVYQIALADFPAPAELEFRGLNLFRESTDSGQSIVGTPGNGGFGKIESKALEASNVDLTAEFVNLIAAQRGFQANTRVITVGNEILAEMVNLIR